MKNIFSFFIFVLFLTYSNSPSADVFQQTTLNYVVCFTPGGQCTQDIVIAIKSAKKQILVQAYQLTSAPIALALIDANKRGVEVKVILDKSQQHKRRGQLYSPASLLANHGIAVWIDYKPAIAHNKVMVIDRKTVITGSFNFSKAAQYRNAENLLILENAKLARIYADNWQDRLNASEEFLKAQ